MFNHLLFIREHLQNNRQLLLKLLSDIEGDSAQVLLIATQILFQSITQTMIKVSGKFVSVLLGFLQKYLSDQDFFILQNYHGMILKLSFIVKCLLNENIIHYFLFLRSCCTTLKS